MTNRYLPAALRRALEKTAKDARVVAEDGARDAIRRLGIADSTAPAYLRDDEKELRRRLRAHARALGDAFDKTDETQRNKRLVEAAAYAHWHRMLFARFLAERGLLRNPEYDVPVSLEDCRELAEAEGLTDPWAIAERYAASMLPAVFRIDDPVLALQLDPVHTQKLHRLVSGLDEEVFQAEDSLGWTYQFWRAAEKDAVNASGVKIGADELPAVTQLFTEPYMVRFLLHNTLGAWWAGKVLAADPELAQTALDEDALRLACSLPDYTFDMLRFVRKSEVGPWVPAAGTFPGWPKETKEITMLDPCCGSGHFLTEALAIFSALRKVEEDLSPSDTVVAALLDNLHGLEIDGRCVQIAAFAVALSAWRIGGWQTLPTPHIAWVGAPPPLPQKEFAALANGDEPLSNALKALHEMFARAPILGTLLASVSSDLFDLEKGKRIAQVFEPLLEKARQTEPERIEGAIAARGMADAAILLRKKFTIQATNVPFLSRGKQSPELAAFIEKNFPDARPDLATAMILRMIDLSESGGTICAVSPQNWLYQPSYRDFRENISSRARRVLMSGIGSQAFSSAGTWDINTLLFVFQHATTAARDFSAIELGTDGTAAGNEELLKSKHIETLPLANGGKSSGEPILLQVSKGGKPISDYADYKNGMQTGDYARFGRNFWEIMGFDESWRYFASTIQSTSEYDGLNGIVKWDHGRGDLANHPSSVIRGTQAWGRRGVAISAMGRLYCSLYTGELFDDNTVCLLPSDPAQLLPLWAYCSSSDFHDDVRVHDKALKVRGGLVKPVFELEKWRSVAEAKYPNGIPEPYSDNPTQWLFHGHPANSRIGTGLHVAMARLSGYRWPAETDTDLCLSEESSAWIAKAAELPLGDNDGFLGVPPVAVERSLADRLRTYLKAAFGSSWSETLERRLVAEADELLDKKIARDGSLEAWVRDRAFSQHCTLFGQRPFLWHISDGLKDGFSVFIHYHRLDQANLRKLTYTLLGDWLTRAKAENNALRYEKGRELQQMLEKVLEGEKLYDIFVRWKSLAQQPLGWDPDLDDGVRQNIRPFIKAGVLTHDLSKILKDKDRGNDVALAPWYPVFNGERRNDHHTTLAEKRAAREAAVRRAEAAK